MRLNTLFEELLTEAIKPSTETIKDVGILAIKYNLKLFDKDPKTKNLKRVPVYDMEFPSPSIRSKFIKAITNHKNSLKLDIVSFLKNVDLVDRNSVTVTTSNYRYEKTNETSLSTHIHFKLKEFKTPCQIKISDHYSEQSGIFKGIPTYFMGITVALTGAMKHTLHGFVYKVYKQEYEKIYGKQNPEVVNQSIIPRDETKVKRKVLSLNKPKKIDIPVAINFDPNKMSSKEAYGELISPTRLGIKNNFYYDDKKPFNQQVWPNYQVKLEYVTKLNNLVDSFFNDVAQIIHRIPGVYEPSIKVHSSTDNTNGFKSHSKYLHFRFDNAKHGCAIRSSDHASYHYNDKEFVFSVPQTTWASDKFKLSFAKFVEAAKTDNFKDFTTIIKSKNNE